MRLCLLALVRVIENTTGHTCRNLHHELDRMHLVTLATDHGRVAQLRADHRAATTLTALKLPEPPRFFDFTAPTA